MLHSTERIFPREVIPVSYFLWIAKRIWKLSKVLILAIFVDRRIDFFVKLNLALVSQSFWIFFVKPSWKFDIRKYIFGYLSTSSSLAHGIFCSFFTDISSIFLSIKQQNLEFEERIFRFGKLYTVLKFHDFSINQILREIHFWESRCSKTVVFPIFEALNFVY